MTNRCHSHNPNIFARLGALRSLLMIAGLAVITAAPFADGSVYTNDWRLLPTVIAPTVTMMLIFAIPLDITMAKIFMSDAQPDEVQRLKFAVRVDLIILATVLIAWTPFFITVL